MTSSPVSFQGFTYENDMCDTLKLSHPRGAPHTQAPRKRLPSVDSENLLCLQQKLKKCRVGVQKIG
jgi:hypothetical protein